MSRARLVASLGFCVLAPQARAHSPLPGIEGFYSGLLHPFVSSDQVLVILAIGLLFSSFPMHKLRHPFAALGLGLLAGLVLGMPRASPAPWLFGLAVVCATTAALAPGRGLPFAIAFGLGAGALLGWASLPEAGPLRDRLFTMSGAVVGAGLGTFYLTGALEMLRERWNAPWCTIGARIVGTWLSAIALLMLSLHLAQDI